ncbi:hypothetical protein BZA70DRAFT_290750 [Myxozyma melibiosi]|uniref:DUF4045 domain-containing protein n=1 Tax=Myxozyma melibiosi TaxID=54550 RepID=A0ABR1F2X9_9ASCO
MVSTTSEEVVGDTNITDFLKRLEDLKLQSDDVERERSKKLEEEIEESKRQRLARRTARSGSTSPDKLSTMISTIRSCQTQPTAPSPSSLSAATALRSPTAFNQQTLSPSPSPRRARAQNSLSLAPNLSYDQTASPKSSPVENFSKRLQKLDSPASPLGVKTQPAPESPTRRNLSELEKTVDDSPKQSLTGSDNAKNSSPVLSPRGFAERSSNLKERLARARSVESAPSSPSRYAIGRPADGGNDGDAAQTDEREEERLSKFLRSPSTRQQQPQPPAQQQPLSQPSTPTSGTPRGRVTGNYAPIFPSPSVATALSRSPSTSPDRSSQFRSSRLSGIGTFASSDFYSGSGPSPAELESGSYVVQATRPKRSDSILSNSSQISIDSINEPPSSNGSVYGSPRSPSPSRPKSPTKGGFVQSAMMRRDGGSTPISKRLSMANLRPAPVVLGSPNTPAKEYGEESIEGEIVTSISSPRVSDERMIPEQIVEEETEEAAEQAVEQAVEEKVTPSRSLRYSMRPAAVMSPGSPRSAPTSPINNGMRMSPSRESPSAAMRMRASPSLHRTPSSLSMTRSATDRFRARDLDLVARHDEDSRNSTAVSEYSESNFKPSKTYQSLADCEDEDGSSAKRRGLPRSPGGVVLGALNNSQPVRRVSNSTPSAEKENTGVEGEESAAKVMPARASPSRTATLLSRSGSRSPAGGAGAGKKYGGGSGHAKTSSWLESALMKSSVGSPRSTTTKRDVQ